MIPSSAMQRSSMDEEERQRREAMTGSGPQHLPTYQPQSPTRNHLPNHSPTAASYPPPHYNGYPARPTSSSTMQPAPTLGHSPRLGPPASPTNGSIHPRHANYPPREVGSTTYYDPTSDNRDAYNSRSHPAGYPQHSPSNSRENHYYDPNTDLKLNKASQQSPITARFPQNSPTFPNLHSHPSSHQNSVQHSPTHLSTSPRLQQGYASMHSQSNGAYERHNSLELKNSRPQSSGKQEEPRASRPDPMAFSSILSSAPVEPPKPVTTPQVPVTKAPRKSSKTLNGDTENMSAPSRNSTPTSIRKMSLGGVTSVKDEVVGNIVLKPASKQRTKPIISSKKPAATPDKENERILKAMADIDAMQLSDVDKDTAEYAALKEAHKQASLKRQATVDANEGTKRKKRRTHVLVTMANKMVKVDEQGKAAFRSAHEEATYAEVQRKEVLDEKERKKDMQRKRRREKTIQNETQKQKEAFEKAQQAADKEEREKFLKEAQKAEKKAKLTKRVLEIGDVPEDFGAVTPLASNLEGGSMSSFHFGANDSPEPPKKKHRGPVTRPKKSKEQKQAEKDAAEAAHAAMENNEPVPIAPKGESRRETILRESKEAKATAKDATPQPTTTYTSKGYVQIYEQIWKDIARKDIPKVYRLKNDSERMKESNLRKTAQLASKEARRWQLRTNKSTKDVQARAKRIMRETMTFWKRNEREERDMRRVAEKQELDNAKKAEAEREANRQKRKLNFLISQTELYSHFIGRRIKTDEVERSTDSADVAASGEKVESGVASAHAINLPDSLADVGTKVTNFEDLDFDAEDESVLRKAAMANAQNAVQEAQDRARAFNGEQGGLDEDGEMNFQNPTSLGSVDVSQPKMLTCQLKEYQLKGLNWLVNLYEQGINGILADEMGLGKTVQSISVMAYLAEKHNIWGPFLVIAPASTLHNWQQEITRFVPTLKVLPYWGTAKDRKVLRKFWDRKHITYTKESPFHVLVTSYQLVVQDTQYFQKIRWQYMILDEAQAIKSSQSSRWKSLLGFHCRNRLLLTGTPIQNNMQELWALLHFIMPSLFDSHDEFSEWFSKDIESHAQSNTKLNEEQLKRLHVILKPFMLRRIKKHVQKELGDKIELDVFCDLTYRQRAYYTNLRNKISIMDLIERAAIGENDQDTATLMNLVMQFRKVCNHPDLFERADTTSPFSFGTFAETASFMREGNFINVVYSTRNAIDYDLPQLLCSEEGMLNMAGPNNDKAGFKNKYLNHMFNIWTPEHIKSADEESRAFSWLRFSDTSVGEACDAAHQNVFARAVGLRNKPRHLARFNAIYEETEDAKITPAHALFTIVERNDRKPLADITTDGHLKSLFNISKNNFAESGMSLIEQCSRPAASAPPIEIAVMNQATQIDSKYFLFNMEMRKALYPISTKDERALLDANIDPKFFPANNLLPAPISENSRWTNIQVPSMRRFVTDAGKLAKLDQLLRELKEGGHRVLLYFQMTRMIDLMEEYLTYRNYKYLRLDGSTKLEDRRDTVHDFQTRPEIFIFLLSTRAGGLGINLTSADTVIFYDSDWNPTIDSQAMDRAHRLGQTRQVTVYRMITRGTIEERIRKRALQKEEVQRVVISGGSGAGVDFNTRSRENRTKDIAMWLADDEQAELIEKKEKEVLEKEGEGAKEKDKFGKGGKAGALKKTGGRKKDVSLDDMYHEGEGHFDDGSAKPSGAATPVDGDESGAGKKGVGSRGGKGLSKKAKTAKQRLAIVDGMA